MAEPRMLNKVAIVTGASRGIGAAVARLIAQEGALVALAARSRPNSRLGGSLDAVASEISGDGGRAIAIRCDVSDQEDRTALVETTRRELGPIDVLINNAAVFGTQPFAEMPLSRFARCFEVNIFAPYALMQLVTPQMIERRRGWIVNISSDASRRPGDGPYQDSGPGATGYGSSKAALEVLTRSVAHEMGPHGLAIAALMPSKPVPTPAMLELDPDLTDMVTEQSFAEAVVRVLAAEPSETNGRILYSEDVLHPELGTRGWMAPGY